MFTISRTLLRPLPKSFFSSISQTKYGNSLATRFASALEKKHQMLPYRHQAYCGVGFYYIKGKFHFCRVWDGDPMETLIMFNNKEAFIEWFSSKSDAEMMGNDPEDAEMYEKDSFYRGNQRFQEEHVEIFIREANVDK